MRDPLAFDAALRSDAFVRVRRRIFRQLVESLLYEGILDADSDSSGNYSATGEDAEGNPVTYAWRARRRLGFDRVRLSADPITRSTHGRTEEAMSPAHFLLDLRARHRAPEDLLARFINELDQTLLKDTLCAARAIDLTDRAYDDLESLGDGHPYHPAYKSRVGFDYVDDASFGPEARRDQHPIWVAARLDRVALQSSTSIDPQSFLADEQAPMLDGYVAIPVHPWQWRETVAPLLFHEIREGRLRVLGTTRDAYRPQQSIRTLANISRPRGAYMKLALSIVNTSTSRLLAPHTVCNGPLVSDWLHGLAVDDPVLREVVILREVLGTAYHAPRLALQHDARYGILSCIWRESLHSYLRAGERALPWNALCHVDAEGRPLIAPWIEAHGLERWLRRLLEVGIPPILQFLCAHGVALESHAQNMILLHDDGWPLRLALKDFHDGVRFAPHGLADRARMPKLHATPASHVGVNRNSFVVTDDIAKVRDFVLDAFFFVNLSEVALVLEEHYGLDEGQFWAFVDDTVRAWESSHPELSERIARFDLRCRRIEVEKLTNRRMFAESEVQVHAVSNPLAAVHA